MCLVFSIPRCPNQGDSLPSVGPSNAFTLRTLHRCPIELPRTSFECLDLKLSVGKLLCDTVVFQSCAVSELPHSSCEEVRCKMGALCWRMIPHTHNHHAVEDCGVVLSSFAQSAFGAWAGAVAK